MNKPSEQATVAIAFSAQCGVRDFAAIQQLRDDLLGRLCLSGLDAAARMSDGTLCEGIGSDWVMLFEVIGSEPTIQVLTAGINDAGLGPNDYEIAVLDSGASRFASVHLPNNRTSHLHGLTLVELVMRMRAGETPPESEKTLARYNENLRRFAAVDAGLTEEYLACLRAISDQLNQSNSTWNENWMPPSNWFARLLERSLQKRRTQLYKLIRGLARSLSGVVKAEFKRPLDAFLASPCDSFVTQRTAIQNLKRELDRPPFR